MSSERRRTIVNRLRRIAPATTAVLGMVAALTTGVLTPSAPAQASPLPSTPLITYNMQGASSGADSKWTRPVLQYIRAAEIVTLQEAGPTPPGTYVGDTTIPALPQVGRAGFIQHHRWRSSSEDFEVYFLQTDAQNGRWAGGRNNLAIVTHRQADEITAVPNPDPRGRPALGVRFDNDWYFSVHAQALGGRTNDAQALTNAVANFVNDRNRGEQWTIAGDFNVHPGTFPTPPGSTIYNTGLPTHQSGNEWDYVLASVGIPDHPVRRLDGASADHYAVAVGGLRAGAEPTPLFTTPRTLENMQDGAVIETYLEHTDNNTPVTAFRRTGGKTQEWKLEFYNDGKFRIRLGDDGRCAQPWLNDDSTFRPRLRDCSNDLAQWWTFQDVGDGQQQIRHWALGSCLDVGDSQRPTAVDLRLEHCDAARPSQHWLLSPAATPARTEISVDPVDYPVAFPTGGLENAATKQLLRRDVADSRTLVTTTPHHSQDAAPQQLTFDWLPDSRLEIRDPDHNRCVAEENDQGRPTSEVTMRPCDRADPLQQFTADPVGENEFRLVGNTTGEAVCLHTDALPDPDTSFATMTVCRADFPTMRWYFAPTTTTTLDPS